VSFSQSIKWFERVKYPLLIALLVIASLYTLSCFQFIPKWDSVRGYLPYRYFISDYLHEGHLPLWNPFQRLGYPGYSDLQSGAWYPVLWLLLLFGKYTITSLIVEVVACFLIAGWGMYKLSVDLHGCKKTATLLGVSYALSGFMVGSTQLMVFLIGMAWLPWIVWSLLRLLQEGRWRYGLSLALALMCNVTGASPAFTIILLYVLPIIIFIHLWKRRNDWAYLRNVLLSLFLCGAVLSLLLLPFFIAFIDFFPYFNRTGKLAYADMIINPFVPADFITFLFPYAALSTGSWFQVTDLSLRNAYVGLIGFSFFLLSMLIKVHRSKWHFGLIVGCVISMVLALGDFSGIYEWVYHLPGFGLFRHPAFFRGYAMLCILLLSGFALRHFLSGEVSVAPARRLWWMLLILSLVAFGYGFFTSTKGSIAKTLQEIATRFEFPAAGFEAQLTVASAAAGLLLVVLLWFTRAQRSISFAALFVLVGVDFFIQTQLTAPTTIHHAIGYEQTDTFFEQVEQLPDHDQRFNQEPLQRLDESNDLIRTAGLDRNISTYNHTLSAVGENHMRFKAFDRLKESGRMDWILANPLFYVPKCFADAADTITAGCIFGAPIHLDEIGDSCTLEQPIVDFNAYKVKVTNSSNAPRWVVLNANYHHLWTAQYGNEAIDIVPVNELVMGVRVAPHTEGLLQFRFESPYLPAAWIISSLTLILCAFILVRKARENVA
jgi:hypothetical protein